jgi:hypothetical protein
MDRLTRQLNRYATRICDSGLEGMPEIQVIADLIRESHPVIASVLESSGEPKVARERAFSVAARALVGLSDARRRECSSALAEAGVQLLSAPRNVARAA